MNARPGSNVQDDRLRLNDSLQGEDIRIHPLFVGYHGAVFAQGVGHRPYYVGDNPELSKLLLGIQGVFCCRLRQFNLPFKIEELLLLDFGLFID